MPNPELICISPHSLLKQQKTVARESAELEKDSMRLSLDAQGNKGSYFTVMPVYKTRANGDKVRVADHVYLYNKKYGQYLHFSNYRYPRNNKLEVNVSTVAQRWRLNEYATNQGLDSSRFLNVSPLPPPRPASLLLFLLPFFL